MEQAEAHHGLKRAGTGVKVAHELLSGMLIVEVDYCPRAIRGFLIRVKWPLILPHTPATFRSVRLRYSLCRWQEVRLPWPYFVHARLR